MMAKKAAVVKKEDKVKKVKFTGFEPLKFKEFTITQKSSGRYEVVNAKGANVNGADKVHVLTEAKVFKKMERKAPAAEATPAT
jgi:hypothetical protein